MNKVDLRGVTEAHELLITNKRFDLAVTYFGHGWIVIRFDPEKSCWYNPDNRYPSAGTPYMAVLWALEKDKAEGYIPEYGSGVENVEIIY